MHTPSSALRELLEAALMIRTINLSVGDTTCPMCCETKKIGALKCKHCGELFS